VQRGAVVLHNFDTIVALSDAPAGDTGCVIHVPLLHALGKRSELLRNTCRSTGLLLMLPKTSLWRFKKTVTNDRSQGRAWPYLSSVFVTLYPQRDTL
jgi:hypothetical protein